MPRRGFIAKRDVLPDPIYNSKVVTKLINNIMLDGKKSLAQNIVYDAFEIVKEKEGKNPRTVREFFSSKEVEVDAEIFEGAKLVVAFGEIDYDLTKAIIEKDSGIYASAIFGRINIKVPEGVNVQVESNSILGGFSNRTNNSPDAPTIYVNGTCLFGDVEISCE